MPQDCLTDELSTFDSTRSRGLLVERQRVFKDIDFHITVLAPFKATTKVMLAEEGRYSARQKKIHNHG